MKRKEGCMLRSIGGMDIIVPVSGKRIRLDAILTLQGAGGFLWERLKEDCTKDELLAAVLSEYDVDKETAQADIGEFLKKAQAAGILEHE